MKRLDWLLSLQTRLIVASAAAVVLAIFVTGGVFVYRDRQEQRDLLLARIAGATEVFSLSSAPLSGSITTIEGAAFTYEAGSEQIQPFNVVKGGASLNEIGSVSPPDYRILLVSPEGQVVNDPAGRLAGVRLEYPGIGASDAKKGYVTWPGEAAKATGGITFLAPTEPAMGSGSGLTAVAAIDSTSLTADWLATVPDLALSGLVGLPVAVLAAVFVTRRVTQPLRRLTHAVEGMSRGDFDQRVEVKGRDEVAVLASSFTVMAGRVKERDTQLRNLLANVSHDLRTPLTSIQGYAEALADGVTKPGEVDRSAQIIRDEARHASSLLANLLGLSEIDSGEVVVRTEPFDLAQVLLRCVRRLEPRARDRNVQITLNAPSELAVSGDEEKAERAVANLIENAVKFAASRVDVRLEALQGEAIALVRNDGVPIAADDVEKVFERFYRGRGPNAGSGLGLTIARELVELQGGRLTMHSSGAPVEFRVSLPLL